MKTATIELDWMTRADYPAVVGIDWIASQRRTLSLTRVARLLRCQSVMGHVAKVDGIVVGFAIRELHIGHRRLVALAVLPEYQRQGIGSRLLRAVARRNDGGVARVVAVTRETNLTAHLWLRANGFRATRVERGRFGNGDDAYVFVREGLK